MIQHAYSIAILRTGAPAPAVRACLLSLLLPC